MTNPVEQINFPYILDNHVHLDPRGDRENNLKKFAEAGGTHIVLVNKPYHDSALMETKSHQKNFDITLDLADVCRKAETGVTVYVVLGPYPVDFLKLAEKIGTEDAKAVMFKSMDLAVEHIQEGRAIALGEIGRPHFPVSQELMDCSNEILEYGMGVAGDAGCPVVLHTESATEQTWIELAEMADRSGLKRDKVVKHFSPPAVDETENRGLFPSVLAKKKSVKDAAAKGDRFMMETDFLDDPRRPGAVLGITTVPKVTKMLLTSGLATEDQLFNIHKNHPEKIYGIDMDL